MGSVELVCATRRTAKQSAGRREKRGSAGGRQPIDSEMNSSTNGFRVALKARRHFYKGDRWSNLPEEEQSAGICENAADDPGADDLQLTSAGCLHENGSTVDGPAEEQYALA